MSKKNLKAFWFVDVFVVFIFLSTAAFSLYLFRSDLMRTIEIRDEEPVGFIVIRNNVVQRRYADRVLWERLFVDSPVYSGDLIRAADLSAASIHVDENQLNLNENTLIRIQHSSGGRGPFNVELREGNLSVTTGTGSGGGIMLSVMGKQIHITPGTLLSAALGEEGMEIRVSEGSAVIIEEGGHNRELTTGMIFAQDSEGMEIERAAVVVTQLQPNARYLKSTDEPIPVNFLWNRINLYTDDTLRMEIAEDRNFNRNVRVIEGLNDHANIYFDIGSWFWRISFEGDILSAGEINVADSSGPDLLSPVMNSIFRYNNNNYPSIRFQWTEKHGASHYILEVADNENFSDHQIKREISASSFIQSELGEGTWYWRVLPVYSSVFEGSASYSQTGSFRIEQSSDIHAPALELPEPVIRAYTVIPGDTLNGIAARIYGDPFLWVKIAEANNIYNPDFIFPGQLLLIPSFL